jgi:YidC/Oxa1 family membrane protein insertase
MDRRTLLAIGLMLVVALLPSLLFPPRRPPPRTAGTAGDTTAPPTAAAVPAESVPATPEATPRGATPRAPDSVAPQRVVVESPLYRFTFTSLGARLVEATLKRYRSYARGDSGLAQIVPAESRFLELALVVGSDTIPLSGATFQPSDTALRLADSAAAVLTWTAVRPEGTVRLTYTFRPEEYLFHVRGDFSELATRGLVLIGLGPRIAFVEADSAEDFRSYAVVTKATKTESVTFRSLIPARVAEGPDGVAVATPGERRALPGPFEWVAVKSKYFVVAVLATDQGQPRFGGAIVTGGLPVGDHRIRADVRVSLPAPSGVFGYAVYSGPQEFRRLARVGHEFEDINPYGWIFRPIIRPFANLIVRILIWMHESLRLAYGWVLVLFGIAVRIVLWPLNQKAMRSSVAMQAVQPEMKAVQERYRNDPQKLQREVMRLYREHGVNPLGGCLPLLLPMPVLVALFFVFRETIEFRGVPFLWLPDLSRADPLYIIPVVMGASMFAVSKIGQMGIPPNPQTKMMTYVMPVMLTVLFLNFSSGLNLYYAVSNVASVPQQWLIARERRRRQPR